MEEKKEYRTDHESCHCKSFTFDRSVLLELMPTQTVDLMTQIVVLRTGLVNDEEERDNNKHVDREWYIERVEIDRGNRDVKRKETERNRVKKRQQLDIVERETHIYCRDVINRETEINEKKERQRETARHNYRGV